MSDKSYELLADALDALPNRFPRTPSRVEISILKKGFTPEEAEIAGHMGRKYETAEEVAARTGLPAARVKEVLDGLLPRRLVRQRGKGSRVKYRLGPYLVGWWEAMIERNPDDREFIDLHLKYLAEGAGELIHSPRPGLLGVVPARGALKKELLQPYDDIDAHFARYERFHVTGCVCRLERNTLGSKCDKPVNRCEFVGLPPHVPLSEHVLDREQAIKLFTELEDSGHVHLGFYGFTATAKSPQFVGCCNCCGDCCGILRAITELGLQEGPQRSNYRAVLNETACLACGDCVERCQVHAITRDKDSITIIDKGKCIGCGLCVIKCPGEAIELVPVPQNEWFDVPRSFEEWEERRLRAMGKLK